MSASAAGAEGKGRKGAQGKPSAQPGRTGTEPQQTPEAGADAIERFPALADLHRSVTDRISAAVEQSEIRPVVARGRVEAELAKLAISQIARDMFAGETFRSPPDDGTLAEQLERPAPDVSWRIEGLWPARTNVTCAAQYKTGKTTLALNVARSLADDVPFLDTFEVEVPAGRIGYWNHELSPDLFLAWCRALRITKPDRIAVAHLKGYPLPLTTTVAADWAEDWLRTQEVEVWIIDPFGAAFHGDENSNSEVGAWLRAVEEVASRAGVTEVLVPLHTGRAQQVYTKDDTGQRFLAVSGRLAEVPQFSVDFDEANRSLRFGEYGTRAQVANLALFASVVDAVKRAGRKGLKTTDVKAEAGRTTKSDNKVRKALEKAEADGLLWHEDIKPRGQRWFHDDVRGLT
jgi:hypothetical protein